MRRQSSLGGRDRPAPFPWLWPALLSLMVIVSACASEDAADTEREAEPVVTTVERSTSASAPDGLGPVDEEPVTVLAVADLADCRGPDAEVAELVRSLDGVILMAGDLAYRDGSIENYEECFLPLYQSELDRIYATPGDNDYNTAGAEPYFEVMADGPGEPGKGWYVVDLGSWQLVSLNSNCDAVGGCQQGSEQYRWLDETLQEQRYACRIVMWHEPRFTSAANYRGIPRLGDFYGRLHGAGADVVIVGNSHHYERLGPLAPNGEPAPGGMMNFTVGVGGAPFTEFGEPRPGSQVRSNRHRGVLRLTLRSDGYDWEFLNVASNPDPLIDQGSEQC